jgi:hypothetical protein
MAAKNRLTTGYGFICKNVRQPQKRLIFSTT